jgi:hypothetical protein
MDMGVDSHEKLGFSILQVPFLLDFLDVFLGTEWGLADCKLGKLAHVGGLKAQNNVVGGNTQFE